MENIADELENIVNQSDADLSNLEQLKKFEETLQNLQKILTLEKPVYSLPQVDTIGKHTYTLLNKNSAD